MKTSKAKTIRKPLKTAEIGETGKSNKVIAVKPVPVEEKIRKKAYEIYLQRISRGEHGTAADDWHKAKELLKGS